VSARPSLPPRAQDMEATPEEQVVRALGPKKETVKA
jgi:hypothetical protein